MYTHNVHVPLHIHRHRWSFLQTWYPWCSLDYRKAHVHVIGVCQGTLCACECTTCMYTHTVHVQFQIGIFVDNSKNTCTNTYMYSPVNHWLTTAVQIIKLCLKRVRTNNSNVISSAHSQNNERYSAKRDLLSTCIVTNSPTQTMYMYIHVHIHVHYIHVHVHLYNVIHCICKRVSCGFCSMYSIAVHVTLYNVQYNVHVFLTLTTESCTLIAGMGRWPSLESW